MRTFKKSLSLILCLLMLVGTVIIGVSAASSLEPSVKSYAELAETYPSKGFFYLGAEVLDKNGMNVGNKLVAGEELTLRYYVKSNMNFGTATKGVSVVVRTVLDNSFFTISNTSSPVGSVATATGSTFVKSSGDVTTALYKSATPQMGVKDANDSNKQVYSLDDVNGWTIVTFKSTSTYKKQSACANDDMYFDVTVKVNESATGTGRAFSPSTFYAAYQGTQSFAANTIGYGSATPKDVTKADNFINDTLTGMVFTIAENTDKVSVKINKKVGSITESYMVGSNVIDELPSEVTTDKDFLGVWKNGKLYTDYLRTTVDTECDVAYASDKVTVDLDVGDGNFSGTKTFQVNANEIIDVDKLTDGAIPTKDGFTFYAWERNGRVADEKTITIKALYYANGSQILSLKALNLNGEEISIVDWPVLSGASFFGFSKDLKARAAENPTCEELVNYLSTASCTLKNKLGYTPYFVQSDGTYATTFDTTAYANFCYPNDKGLFQIMARANAFTNTKYVYYLQTAYGTEINFYAPTIISGIPDVDMAKEAYSVVKTSTVVYPAIKSNSSTKYDGFVLGDDKPVSVDKIWINYSVVDNLDNPVAGFDEYKVYDYKKSLFNIAFTDGKGTTITQTEGTAKSGSYNNKGLYINLVQSNKNLGTEVIDVYPTFTAKEYQVMIDSLYAYSTTSFKLGETINLNNLTFDFNNEGKVSKTMTELQNDTTGFGEYSGYKVKGVYLDSGKTGANQIGTGITIDEKFLTSNLKDGSIVLYPDLEALTYTVKFYALSKDGWKVAYTKNYKVTDEDTKGKPQFSDVPSDVITAIKADDYIPEGRILGTVLSNSNDLTKTQAAFGGYCYNIVKTNDEYALYFKYSLGERYVYSDTNSMLANITKYTFTYGQYILYNDEENLDSIMYDAQGAKKQEKPAYNIIQSIGFDSSPEWKYATDKDGNVVYETKTVIDENGNPVIDPLTGNVLKENDLTKPIVKDPKNSKQKPYRNCEFMGWKYYYVLDTIGVAANLPAESEWIEGYGPENSIVEDGVVATVTHIAKAQWKSDEDFIVRFYSTNFTNNTQEIKMAISKDFKVYYWNNNKPCTKDEMIINNKPADNTLLFFTPEKETLEFTDANGKIRTVSSWRLDAKFIKNSLLDIRTITGLLETALGIAKAYLYKI